ncbi:hypothetical protein [Agrococcus sp. Ld7]|uniref:hypothetical protein n=1 Tax=Agrococcus sp. Ld7 TaxID=649148 RepID=UPI00386AEE96
MTQWRPRNEPDIYDDLDEGVPSWLESSLLTWINKSVERWGLVAVEELVRAFDRLRRGTHPLAGDGDQYYLGHRVLKRKDDDFALDFVDFMLFNNVGDRSQLEQILTDAGSAWTVSRPGPRGGEAGLTRRVGLPMQEAAHEAMTTSDGGALLTEAWHAAFGRSPDPEDAYEKAIKAVEAAGVHVVSPKNSKATLGTMIRDMRAQADWRLPTSVPGREQAADVVVSMMDALWNGQGSRHGGNGYIKPTQEQGEVAVFLAVPLVQWFNRGVIVQGAKWPTA